MRGPLLAVVAAAVMMTTVAVMTTVVMACIGDDDGRRRLLVRHVDGWWGAVAARIAGGRITGARIASAARIAGARIAGAIDGLRHGWDHAGLAHGDVVGRLRPLGVLDGVVRTAALEVSGKSAAAADE